MNAQLSKLGLVGDRGRFGSIIRREAEAAGIELVLSANSEAWAHTDRPDVLIDVSAPRALSASVAFCQDQQVPLLVGTSGLSKDEEALLRDLGERVPVCWAANCSPLHYLQRAALHVWAQACRHADLHAQVQVLDRHPKTKKDSPSATAMKLARHWEEQTGVAPDVGSIRGGLPVSDHSVELTFDGETLTAVHAVQDRSGPARGALRIARALYARPAGYYDPWPLLAESLGLAGAVGLEPTLGHDARRSAKLVCAF
jgi:4-hydroxy-tetrahydrodipicolinate reductase